MLLETIVFPVAGKRFCQYFKPMVCAISQPAELHLRRSRKPENVLAEVFFVAYGYRSYSSELGRWINRDPIGEKGGVNLMGFVVNNPFRFTDHTGNKGVDWSLALSPLKEAADSFAEQMLVDDHYIEKFVFTYSWVGTKGKWKRKYEEYSEQDSSEGACYRLSEPCDYTEREADIGKRINTNTVVKAVLDKNWTIVGAQKLEEGQDFIAIFYGNIPFPSSVIDQKATWSKNYTVTWLHRRCVCTCVGWAEESSYLESRIVNKFVRKFRFKLKNKGHYYEWNSDKYPEFLNPYQRM